MSDTRARGGRRSRRHRHPQPTRGAQRAQPRAAQGAARRRSELDERDDIAAIVLTGADPAFCAGLDLKELGRRAATPLRGDAAAAGRSARPETPAAGARSPRWPPRSSARSTASPSPAASSWPWRATSSSRPSGPASPTPTPGSGSCRAGGSPSCCPRPIGVRRAKELSTTGNFLDAADRARLGPREPRRAPRRPAAVLPAARPPTSRPSIPSRCAGCSRPTTRAPCGTAPGAWALEAEVAGRVAGRRPRSRRPRGEPPGRRRPGPHPALRVRVRARRDHLRVALSFEPAGDNEPIERRRRCGTVIELCRRCGFDIPVGADVCPELRSRARSRPSLAARQVAGLALPTRSVQPAPAHGAAARPSTAAR